MTREQYDEFSVPLVRTMQDMEDEILRLIAAQLARDGSFSDTSKWRIRQLARSGEMSNKAVKIIASYSGVETGQATEAIEAAALTEISYVDGAVADLARRGLFDAGTEIPAQTSAMNAVKAFQRQAKSDLNLVNTVMAYKAKSAFVKAVNDTYFESEKSRQRVLDTMGKYSAANVMGQMSLQESTRRCIRELAQKGIPAFIDKKGREWSPEAYVMMDMRSTLGNTARAAQNARCDEYGINLIEVSSHMGARPLCAPYQGRIFSRDGTSGTTTDAAGKKISYSPLSETSYGESGGLFGINCGHVQYPFFPGCSFQSYFPYPEEENSKRYREFQQQRAMEKKIRATKRECMMFNETGDTEAFREASVRLKNQRNAYRDYSKAHGLRAHNDRTQVLGFDRSVSSKASWANRKAENAAKSNAVAAKVNGGSSSSGGRAVTVSVVDGTNGDKGKIYSDVGLTNRDNGDIINQAKPLEMFNDHSLTSNSPITAQHIINELQTTNIGKTTLADLESLPERIKLTYEFRADGVRGEEKGGCVTIYLKNCTNVKWAARSLIHEITHYKYGIGGNQWSECVCVAQELKHARNRDTLTYDEMKTVVKAVKDVYPELQWRKGGTIYGRKKST